MFVCLILNCVMRGSVQVLLCSLSGDIFPKQVHHRTGAEDLKAAYLARLMAVITRWILPVRAVLDFAANQDDSELLAACRWEAFHFTAASVLTAEKGTLSFDSSCLMSLCSWLPKLLWLACHESKIALLPVHLVPSRTVLAISCSN